METRFLLVAALSLAFAAGSVPAGASPPHSASTATTPSQKYAACVVARDRRGSDRFVRAEPGTDEEKAAFAALTHPIGDCGRRVLRGGAEPEHAMLRGLIAEQLWLTTVFRLDSSRSAAYDPNRIDFEKGFDAPPELRDTYRFAWCVATIQSEAIDALLRTPPSSQAEQAAFDALKPPMSRCFAHGRALALDRPVLRALLAEQLYRRYPLPGFGLVFHGARPKHQGMTGIPGQEDAPPVERQNSH
jgi:hypothetical protein